MSRRECTDCIHLSEVHDAAGACLAINLIHGPCPCIYTSATTSAALSAAHRAARSATADWLRNWRPHAGETINGFVERIARAVDRASK